MERGTLAPSPALALLLSEFDRTHSNNPAQYARNIKSFLADYLNSPRPDQYRFSSHNLYELREKLSPAERDYLFKVVDGTKQAVISGEKVKRLELGQIPLIINNGRSHIKENPPTSPTDRNRVSDLREQLEERVSLYLVSVVQTQGVQVLESDRASFQHATTISGIIKDTFTENGYKLEHFKIDSERVSSITSKLISELPQALREQRDRDQSRKHPLDTIASRDHKQLIGNPQQAFQNAYERDLPVHVAREVVQPIIASVTERSLDDEVVEQQISRTFGHAQEQLPAHIANHAATESQHLTHQPRAQELAASPKDQHVRQHTLTR